MTKSVTETAQIATAPTEPDEKGNVPRSIFGVIALLFWVVYILVSAMIVETLMSPVLFPPADDVCNDPALVDSATTICSSPNDLETPDYVVRGLAIANLVIAIWMPIAVVRAKVIPQKWMFPTWCAVAFIVTAFVVSWISG